MSMRPSTAIISAEMAKIAALAAAAAMSFTFSVSTPTAAQQCGSSEKRAMAQSCIRDCGHKFPKPEKADREKRLQCQDACIAACK
jgi:hypothetical protein